LVETQQQQLRVTLASIGDGVVTTDAQGKITLLNPVAEALTGWTNDEAAGQPLSKVFQIINEVTRQTAEDPVGRVIATGHIVGLANHTVLIAKDGTERAIDDSAAPTSPESCSSFETSPKNGRQSARLAFWPPLLSAPTTPSSAKI
jgi:PAS domain S-box-containing protein